MTKKTYKKENGELIELEDSAFNNMIGNVKLTLVETIKKKTNNKRKGDEK